MQPESFREAMASFNSIDTVTSVGLKILLRSKDLQDTARDSEVSVWT